MSHWTSGLPKLDIEPFDPTPLYAAVAETTREQAETQARRRGRLVPALVVGLLLVVGGAVAAALTLLG